MFRSNALPSPLADADVVEHPANDLVPLSHLALDLDVPPVGWDVYLSDRGIGIVSDDLGRRSVSRAAARELILKKQAAESHAREVMARARSSSFSRIGCGVQICRRVCRRAWFLTA
jgi:hypothetical protein